ncbi:MAG: hypothetical protein ACYTF7_06920, partial [Planctomycetota bacterium]
ENAIAVAQLNVDSLPEDISAWRTLLILEMDMRIDAEGVGFALAYMDSMKQAAAEGAIGFRLLDSLAWRLNRSERAEAGYAIIDANYERHPGVYVPLESKAFILRRQGKLDEAIALLEGWIADNPDHARAKNLLVNMKENQ